MSAIHYTINRASRFEPWPANMRTRIVTGPFSVAITSDRYMRDFTWELREDGNRLDSGGSNTHAGALDAATGALLRALRRTGHAAEAARLRRSRAA